MISRSASRMVCKLAGQRFATPVCQSSQSVGQCVPMDSWILHSRRLSRLGGHFGRFHAELPGVLGVQSLPAGELRPSPPAMRPIGAPAQKTVQHVEANVPSGSAHRNEAAINVVPQHQARAVTTGSSSHRVSPYSSIVGGSARFTLDSIPVWDFPPGKIHRFDRTSERPQRVRWRRCAGSISACQTFSGEWRSSLTRIERPSSLRPFVPAPRGPAPARNLHVVPFISFSRIQLGRSWMRLPQVSFSIARWSRRSRPWVAS